MGLWTLAIAVATIISWQSSNPHVRQWVRNLGMNHNDNETILNIKMLLPMMCNVIFRPKLELALCELLI